MYPKVGLPKKSSDSQKIENMSDQDLDEAYGRDASEDTLLPSQNFEEKKTNKKNMISKLKDMYWFDIGKQCILFTLAFWGLFSIVSSFTRRDQYIPTQAPAPAEQHSHTTDITLIDTPAKPTRKSCGCGNTVAESIAMGCVYDSLSPAWLQRHCHDHSLTSEFESIGDGPNGTWLYWADNNHTIPMTLHEVSLLGDNGTARFYASWDWHVQHCAFYWVKLWRSWKGLVQMETRYDNEFHVRHCVDTFQDEAWGVESGVVLDADYEVE